MPRPGDASPKTHAMRLFAAWLILTCLGCGDAKSPVPSTPVSPAPVPLPAAAPYEFVMPRVQPVEPQRLPPGPPSRLP